MNFSHFHIMSTLRQHGNHTTDVSQLEIFTRRWHNERTKKKSIFLISVSSLNYFSNDTASRRTQKRLIHRDTSTNTSRDVSKLNTRRETRKTSSCDMKRFNLLFVCYFRRLNIKDWLLLLPLSPPSLPILGEIIFQFLSSIRKCHNAVAVHPARIADSRTPNKQEERKKGKLPVSVLRPLSPTQPLAPNKIHL